MEQSKNKEERTNPCETDELRQRTEDIYMVKGEDWRHNSKGRGLEPNQRLFLVFSKKY